MKSSDDVDYMELGELNSSGDGDGDGDGDDQDYVSIGNFAMNTTMNNAGLDDIWDGAHPVDPNSPAASPAAGAGGGGARATVRRRPKLPVVSGDDRSKDGPDSGRKITMNYFNSSSARSPSASFVDASSDTSDNELLQAAGTTPSPALSEIDQEYE